MRFSCPVCESRAIFELGTFGNRLFHGCQTCACRFVDPAFLPAEKAERAHYDLHENGVDDPGYRAHLSKLVEPLLEVFEHCSHGLDYGCGPGPALAKMCEEKGHKMQLFDPFFAPKLEVFDSTFDFITCTETAEHFHDPAAEFAKLDKLLRPNGWLGVMTGFCVEDEDFERWHYHRDPTHVVFYTPHTFEWLAKKYGWSLRIPTKNVALFQKAA